MSEAQQVISVIKETFGQADLPICVVVVDNEGLELFSTKNCSGVEDTNILGIMAYEQMNEQIMSRLEKGIDLMVFRIDQDTFFVAPIVENLFLLAKSDLNRLGHVIPLLEGLRKQIAFKISHLQEES